MLAAIHSTHNAAPQCSQWLTIILTTAHTLLIMAHHNTHNGSHTTVLMMAHPILTAAQTMLNYNGSLTEP